MRVPDDIARTATAWGGAAWVAALPRLVAELAAAWELAVGEPYQPSGMTALVLRATRADGTPCVLKVRHPEPESAHEGAALRHYGARAAVALLAEDAGRAALLLERCDPGTPLLAEPDDEVRVRTVAALLAELWAPPPDGHPYDTLAAEAARLAESLRRSPAVDARLRDEALDLLRDLPAGEDPVVLHRDLHAGNVLRAARRPWLAIDPKPLAGDRAYDTAAVLRDRATPETVPRRHAVLVETLGLDPARVRGWALAQALEGAAGCHRAGEHAAAREFAAAAALVAAL